MSAAAEADGAQVLPPLYAVVDQRQGSGAPRIVQEFHDVHAANTAAEALRLAGSRTIEVVLITAIRDAGEVVASVRDAEAPT